MAVNYITAQYGWRGTVLFYALLCAIICIISLPLVPLPEDQDIRNNETTNTKTATEKVKLEMTRKEEKLPLLDTKVNKSKENSNNQTKALLARTEYMQQSKTTIAKTWKSVIAFLSLLKEPKLCLYCMIYGTSLSIVYILYAYLPDMMATEHHFSTVSSGNIILITGIAGITGRLVITGLVYTFKLKALSVTCGCLFVLGCCTLSFSLLEEYSTFIITGVIFGFSWGPFMSLTTENLIEMYGKESLKDTFGFVMLLGGLATLVGPPLAGFIYDMQETYEPIFYICGTLYLVSFICCCVVWQLNRNKYIVNNA